MTDSQANTLGKALALKMTPVHRRLDHADDSYMNDVRRAIQECHRMVQESMERAIREGRSLEIPMYFVCPPYGIQDTSLPYCVNWSSEQPNRAFNILPSGSIGKHARRKRVR